MTPSERGDTGEQAGDGESVGWVQVRTVGMIPPGLPDVLQGGTTGEVQESGVIALYEVDGAKLKLGEPDAIEPGTTVRVAHRRTGDYAKPLDEYKRDKREQKADRRYKAWKKRREREQRKREQRQEAEEFWAQYDIPFEWDVAIKGRRSGLTKGSWGDGRAKNTKEHLYALEAFEAGRLSRDANSYICDDSATFRFDDGERRQDENGESYIPPVTCKTCLKRMERWKETNRED